MDEKKSFWNIPKINIFKPGDDLSVVQAEMPKRVLKHKKKKHTMAKKSRRINRKRR